MNFDFLKDIFLSSRDLLAALSARWEVVAPLVATLFLLNQFAKIRRFASCLVFPALLLLARKLVLFIPVSGAISTEDRVLFWSPQAYWFFLALVAVHVLILLGIRFRAAIDWGAAGCWVFIAAPVGLYYATAALLPVSGASIIYMPVVSLVGVAKLLLVSPLLLPIAWLALFIQLGLVIFTRSEAGREVNKLALVSVLAGGLMYFGFQALDSKPAPLISQLQQTARTKSSDEEKITNFLEVWVEKLPQINRLGVNVIEKNLPAAYKPVEVKRLVDEVPDPWQSLWAKAAIPVALLCGAALLVLLLLVERLRVGDECDLTVSE